MACQKRMFDSRRDARRRARKLGKGRRVYFCQRCGHYHFTSDGLAAEKKLSVSKPAPFYDGGRQARLRHREAVSGAREGAEL